MSGTPILVVDDTPINLKMMRLLLTHEGYDVRTAAHAEEALEMLSDYRPELILADIQLPGMDGLEMTKAVKRDPRTSTIKVVALTACAMKGDRERALSAGCEDYISKPIDTTTLAGKVRDLLARPATRVSTSATSSDSSALLDFNAPEIDSLRLLFLREGTERSQKLAENANTAFDPKAAGEQLHKWIGTGALLGFPEITGLASKAEGMLAEEQVDIDGLADIFAELYLTFADLLEGRTTTLPEALVNATTGKRIALIGFTPERAEAVCAALNDVKALPRLFDQTDTLNSLAIRNCDLLVVHVRPETLASSWLHPSAPAATGTKLVLMGDQRDLMALSPETRRRAVDILVDRGDQQELLMRLAFAVSDAPAEQLVAARELPAEPRLPASGHIVMADDDGIILALVGSALQNHGMSCKSADNGLDALKLIRSLRPQLAVLDVNMPGMSGYEVLAAVRAENLPVKIILLTARQGEEEILQAFRLGADDYLTKPFSPFELVARVRRFLQ